MARRKLFSSKTVSATNQVIGTIVAKPGGLAADVMSFILSPTTEEIETLMGYTWQFGRPDQFDQEWVATGNVTIHLDNKSGFTMPLGLVVSPKADQHSAGLIRNLGVLYLEDRQTRAYMGPLYSLKPVRENVLPFGKVNAGKDRYRSICRHIACSLMTTWIIRGSSWINSRPPKVVQPVQAVQESAPFFCGHV